MKKSELVESVQKALGADTTKVASEAAIAAVLDSIKEGVRKDGNVQIFGFGTFKVSERAAREGRNPKTGEKMQIAASKSVRFSPSSSFKESL